jgi:hypothetical protein
MSNAAPTSRHVRPDAIAVTTRSRKSSEYALPIHADLQPSQQVESENYPMGILIQLGRVRL